MFHIVWFIYKTLSCHEKIKYTRNENFNQNETKQNETKRNETKRREMKQEIKCCSTLHFRILNEVRPEKYFPNEMFNMTQL